MPLWIQLSWTLFFTLFISSIVFLEVQYFQILSFLAFIKVHGCFRFWLSWILSLMAFISCICLGFDYLLSYLRSYQLCSFPNPTFLKFSSSPIPNFSENFIFSSAHIYQWFFFQISFHPYFSANSTFLNIWSFQTHISSNKPLNFFIHCLTFLTHNLLCIVLNIDEKPSRGLIHFISQFVSSHNSFIS